MVISFSFSPMQYDFFIINYKQLKILKWFFPSQIMCIFAPQKVHFELKLVCFVCKKKAILFFG